MSINCPECCAKASLITINVLFQLLGVILLVIGIVLKTGWSVVEKYILPLLGSDSSSDDSTITDYLAEALAGSSYVFIGLGVFISLAGFLGCVGACCKIKTLLIIYVVIIALVLLTQLIFIILLSTAQLDDSIKTSLKNEINTTYGGIADTSATSVSFNVIMMKYNCCGVESYEEFYGAEKWNRIYEVEVDGDKKNITLNIPVACCKMTSDFPDVELLSPNCTWEPNEYNSNMNNSCWDSVTSQLNDYKTLVLSSIATVFCFEILCICLAIYMILRIVQDEKEGKINPWTD